MAVLQADGIVPSLQVLFMKFKRIVFALGPRFVIISFLILSGPGALLVFSFFMAALNSTSENSCSKASATAVGDILLLLNNFHRALSKFVLLAALLTLANALLKKVAFLVGFVTVRLFC